MSDRLQSSDFYDFLAGECARVSRPKQRQSQFFTDGTCQELIFYTVGKQSFAVQKPINELRQQAIKPLIRAKYSDKN
jgi:hypothetical protein